LISEDEVRKHREELKRKTVARMTNHLPMWDQWQSILTAALVWGTGIGGVSVLFIWVLEALGFRWFQSIQSLSVFGICFSATFLLMALFYLVIPSARDLRNGLAYANLGQRCLKLDDYDAALLNLERAARFLAREARSNPAVNPNLGTVYSGLGSAHAALGNYEKSHSYYLLAQQIFPSQDSKDAAFLEMALVEARWDRRHEHARNNLTALLQKIEPQRSDIAIQCLTALASLAVARGDMEGLVTNRTSAMKYFQEHPQYELATQSIALLSIMSSESGDFHGAVEMAELALSYSEHRDIVRRMVELPAIGQIPGSPDVLITYDVERTEQVITRAAAMLSKCSALWLGEDYDQAVDLVWDVARDIREWRGAALMTQKLQKWETAALAYLGRIMTSRNETSPLWQKYYAIGWRSFVFLDDPAIDDLDFHDYIGYGLYSLLEFEDALSQENWTRHLSKAIMQNKLHILGILA
jgi:tetratricopeptide (TPR) repeat protein